MLQFIFSPLAILPRFLVLKMESITIRFNVIFYFGCVSSARPAISLLGVLRIGWWLKISTSPPFFLANNYPSFSEGQSPSVITCLCLSHIICLIFLISGAFIKGLARRENEFDTQL